MTSSDTPGSSGIPPDAEITAAGAWAALIAKREMTVEEQMDFAQWVQDPENERELLLALEIPYKLREVPESQQEIVRAQTIPPAPPRYLPDTALWVRPRVATAATVLLLLAGGVTWMTLPRRAHYSTGVGERLTAVLEDGSRVELNTGTDLEWLGGRCGRRVRLVNGEAWFEVHGDPKCPFRVIVGLSTIEVLGTRFDVYRNRDGDKVSVLDGRILVHGPAAKATGLSAWQLDLATGEQATWSGDRLPNTKKVAEVSKITAWREDHLVFDNQPLPEVVDELQRYTVIPINLDPSDTRLRSIHVTARVKSDPAHIREFVLRLSERPEMQVVDDGKSLMLSLRQQTSTGQH